MGSGLAVLVSSISQSRCSIRWQPCMRPPQHPCKIHALHLYQLCIGSQFACSVRNSFSKRDPWEVSSMPSSRFKMAGAGLLLQCLPTCHRALYHLSSVYYYYHKNQRLKLKCDYYFMRPWVWVWNLFFLIIIIFQKIILRRNTYIYI